MSDFVAHDPRGFGERQMQQHSSGFSDKFRITYRLTVSISLRLIATVSSNCLIKYLGDIVDKARGHFERQAGQLDR